MPSLFLQRSLSIFCLSKRLRGDVTSLLTQRSNQEKVPICVLCPVFVSFILCERTPRVELIVGQLLLLCCIHSTPSKGGQASRSHRTVGCDAGALGHFLRREDVNLHVGGGGCL